MNRVFLIIFFIMLVSAIFGQDFDKVPKQYSFEVGYRNNISNSFNTTAKSGVTVGFDYAWQLSGYTKKKASYISVPLYYTMFSGEDESSAILSYGWTVRHQLARDKKAIPFMGYALLLNQLRLSDVDGSVFGHQTRFAFGYNFIIENKVKPFVEINYSFARFPELGSETSNKIHELSFKSGVRF